MFFSRVSEKGAVKAHLHLHLKRHARKQRVSASNQNKHFQKDIMNYLWGISRRDFTDTFWGHLKLIFTSCKNGHRSLTSFCSINLLMSSCHLRWKAKKTAFKQRPYISVERPESHHQLQDPSPQH